MPVCKQCDSYFPHRVMVDGKIRIVNRRKYCLTCSPFGQHNTRRIHEAMVKNGVRNCESCDKETGIRRKICGSCYARKRKILIKERLIDLVGDKCWRSGCDYGSKEKFGALEFHHMNPKDKLFNVNISNSISKAWESVVSEAKKCALLCANCHREYHMGLIKNEEINILWRA